MYLFAELLAACVDLRDAAIIPEAKRKFIWPT